MYPFEHSLLAHYLSSQDPWYRRHVHGAFFNKNLLPNDNGGKTRGGVAFNNTGTINISDLLANGYKSINDFNLEYRTLSKFFQNYINHSFDMVSIPVYKVECFDKKTNFAAGGGAKNRVVYYFCESLEIGQEANRATQPNTKDFKNSDPYKEKFSDKYTVFDLELRYIEERYIKHEEATTNVKVSPVKRDMVS